MTQNDLDVIAYNKFANGEITLAEYIKYQNRDKIMNYEQKYKEALERAETLIEKLESTHIKGFIYHIFPELKESEDEQHRKWILEYLYDGLRKADEQFKPQFKSAIAWLEKQGENKPAAITKTIDAHPHWISVEEELPPRGRTDPYVSVPVITCKIVNRGLHEIGFQRYIFGNGKWEYCDATHWMPMPEPPKKGGEE